MSIPGASDSEKKRLKAEAKQTKKGAKAEVKRARAEAASGAAPEAELVALVLGQQGAILSLDDIIANLFAATAGKVVLAVIALALLIYGLKHLRLVR
jgi:hypothetical protein